MINWKERYMREVEGLNNEGDPIGGDPPSGLRHTVEYFKAENAAQAKRIENMQKFINEAVSFLTACETSSMSRNNMENLASELLDLASKNGE